MAKFSKCSQCQIRTRKIVRDPATQKNIYLCPKCYQLRKEKKNEMKKQKEMKNELPAVKEDNIVTPTQVAIVSPIRRLEIPVASADAVAATNETLSGPGNVSMPRRVPHLMEVFVINGRKCIAISEKALIHST
ncbi:uncharacterized protein LOC133837162 [Drosophila sulfurigaster albostrigata]|uniref:uncharacterized protein LOC133837162 n=1 Tax=Drosophila sulfurigaster albostrigata TaxID=89887 RepID=UPI002D21B33A|nr:uncharacterized protein LOC133837162 [Drosophila sulfurigaster albostrigata]